DEVPIPELAPDEAIVAVMASAINFNTVWTSIFEPLPTFLFLDRLGRESVWGKRHDLPYHIIGSDASGVVLRTGSAVRNWKPGAPVQQGQIVLIWGASGGLGGYACQYVQNGGGIPVAVVSSPEKVGLMHEMGVEHVIDRKAEGYRFWKDERTQDPAEWRRFGRR